MISPKDVIERIQESYAKGREAERAAVVKHLRKRAELFDSDKQGFGVLHEEADAIEKGEHHDR